MSWLRRSFLTGLAVTVPLFITVTALVWTFRAVDGIARPVATNLFGRAVPGLGVLVTVVLIFSAGVVATNVIGRRILQRTERWLMRVPVFSTVYAPVKQLVLAFSPDNEYGFKRVVMIRTESRGYILGFLTKEFSIHPAGGAELLIAVYVPTNHLYLGDVVICRRQDAFFPDLTVEEGIRVFLTGGMTLPAHLTHDSSANVTGRS